MSETKNIYNITRHKIAVLITSYNRCEKTFHCINKLFKILPTCSIYLVDDCSTDNTVQTISSHFPEVKIIYGNGNLFWNRGMHLAWEHANKFDYDFYLWLNDDIVLYENSIQEILECSILKNHQAIISGIIETENKDLIIYGGTDINNKLICPNGQLQSIKNMNGNVVLVPKSVYLKLGNLDPVFHHDLGDVEYGYRAKENNIEVLTSRIPVAYGYRNDLSRVRLNNSDIINRFRNLYSPLGANPFIILYFRKKYKGLFNAIVYFFFLHFINLIPDKLNNLLFKTRYI